LHRVPIVREIRMMRRNQTRFGWIHRDGKLIIAVRGVRTFAHSAASVLLAIYLDLQGFGLFEIGLFLTIGSAGAVFWALVAGLLGDLMGRRRLLTVMGVLSALTGVVLITSQSLQLLTAAAFLGSFSALPGAGGAMGPLEQASLPATAAPDRRTELFAFYGIVGTAAVSLGALAAGLPTVFQRAFGLQQVPAFQAVFGGYALLGVIAALLYSRLSHSVEVAAGEARWVNPIRLPSRSRILTLAGLFTVDSFGTGLLGQSLASYWFFTRFGIPAQELGLLFFASHVLTAISLWVAARLASRIGLVNTMVFTHIPSSLLLIAIPFLPEAWLAVLFWLVRAFFVQMDAPTSQSYTMAVVGPEERSAIAAATSVSRSAGIAAGPVAATALWGAASASAPFMVGGVVKIAYDLTLWGLFRRVKPPEEASEPSFRRSS
jgi:MFS family permease